MVVVVAVVGVVVVMVANRSLLQLHVHRKDDLMKSGIVCGLCFLGGLGWGYICY